METERLGEREPLHPTSQASPPVPASTTTKPQSLPLLLAHRQKLGPATSPILTNNDVEEKLLDYGDAEDLEEIDVDPAAAIDGGDDAETPDLQLVQASTVSAPGSVATSSSATPVAEPNGSATSTTTPLLGRREARLHPLHQDSPDLMTKSRHQL
jgi:hypothetical protein